MTYTQEQVKELHEGYRQDLIKLGTKLIEKDQEIAALKMRIEELEKLLEPRSEKSADLSPKAK